jgi:pimeloyl-ACP methyl ester carboxylesterase
VGGEDPFAPLASAERFAREIPGAELVVIEGTGHFVVDDAPERYAEELVRFIGQVRPGTAR